MILCASERFLQGPQTWPEQLIVGYSSIVNIKKLRYVGGQKYHSRHRNVCKTRGTGCSRPTVTPELICVVQEGNSDFLKKNLRHRIQMCVLRGKMPEATCQNIQNVQKLQNLRYTAYYSVWHRFCSARPV